MTTREVAKAPSPRTDLESECEVVSAPAKPAASLVFFRGEEGLQVWPGTPISRGKQHLEAALVKADCLISLIPAVPGSIAKAQCRKRGTTSPRPRGIPAPD